MRELICSFVFLLFIPQVLDAQQKAPAPIEADFARAESYVWDSISEKVFQMHVSPQWFSDNGGFAYRADTREGVKYYTVSAEGYEIKEAFDGSRLADSLNNFTEEVLSAENLPIDKLQWENGSEFSFFYKEKRFEIDLKNYKISATDESFAYRNKDISASPDGRYEVFIKDYNLHVVDTESKAEKQLSYDGGSQYIYGSAYGWGQTMEGEGVEPTPRLQVKWSPDSKKILTQISDARNAEKMYLLDWSREDKYRPVLLSYYRPSPGDTTFVKYQTLIIDVETGEIEHVNLRGAQNVLGIGLDLNWSKTSGFIYGTYVQRGFKESDIIEIIAANGEVRYLHTDVSPTNINYHTRFRYVEEASLAFFTSEKTGWQHLYVLNWETAEVRQLTKGEFVVRDIVQVDKDARILYFTASGSDEGVNPYYEQLYRMNFDGSDMRLLTDEALNHEVVISPDFRYFVDNMSDALTPTRSVLRSVENGKILMEIQRADISELSQMGWKGPELFTAVGRDGETEIHGAMWKPLSFNSELSYPIIDFTYTGPHTNVFPHTFRKGIYGLYNSAQALAELGFIVVQIDGMGTNGRSKDFHNVSYKNMGNNLLDHVLAIRQLAEKYSWMDITRVGIFGHSAGGYDAAHALLAFGDFYSVAVAQAADHDWRMEKAWWPEMYAGWPVDSVYETQSNITMAPNLKGKLLLIHGGIDENVNPSATFKLAEALIKADKYFDMLIVPSARHHFPKEYAPYVRRKGWDFFVRHLISDK